MDLGRHLDRLCLELGDLTIQRDEIDAAIANRKASIAHVRELLAIMKAERERALITTDE